jgi:hypothetical protein
LWKRYDARDLPLQRTSARIPGHEVDICPNSSSETTQAPCQSVYEKDKKKDKNALQGQDRKDEEAI